ncbi:unnamed protein product [Cuscuta epithymum]|uniref:DUF223 domain-containing protein n=1 Tax=Cuscuta epithymum TaxID=186058 RepID=A0AAV0CIG3_9ASTE|nr:unnamed protein product [Cuscuta epithymum]
MVATDGKDYKTTTNKYKIIFFKKTKVFEFEDATFPNEVYKFRQFETILSTKILNEKEMFDVICVVVGKYGLKELTYNNRPHKIMEIFVCDNMYVKCIRSIRLKKLICLLIIHLVMLINFSVF